MHLQNYKKRHILIFSTIKIYIIFVVRNVIRIFAASLQNLLMKKTLLLFVALAATTAVSARTVTVTVSGTRYQTVTGFGAACCDGAMCPFGTDTQPVKLLYGPTSKIGLNIMRMEISPNFVGDIVVPEWNNWDSPYDWKGSLPSAKIVKQRGGIVFGSPWSPQGDYKTNGSAQGGN